MLWAEVENLSEVTLKQDIFGVREGLDHYLLYTKEELDAFVYLAYQAGAKGIFDAEYSMINFDFENGGEMGLSPESEVDEKVYTITKRKAKLDDA